MSDATTAAALREGSRPASVGRMFRDRVQAAPEREAFRYPTDSGWTSLSWAQTRDRVDAIAAGLVALGVQPEERVAIASSTRVEWILADLGIMCAGGATTTIYPSTLDEDVAYILTDSGSRVVFAEDAGQVAKVAQHRSELPGLLKVVVFDGPAGEDEGVITLAELEQLGAARLAAEPDTVARAVESARPDSLATLIYTSGTTGRPKGVRLSHGNWTYQAAAIDQLGILDAGDLQYLWLPLSHSFGKVLQSAQLGIGFASAVDGRLDKLVENLAVVRPTFMAGAPRIFEKVHSRITTMTEQEGGPKHAIFSWAFGVGRQVSAARQQGKEPALPLKVQHAVADKLVFSKIKHRFGGRVRYFVSGSAALSREVAEWFHAAGILVLEGYGLTETSAFSCVNRPESYAFGTVGLPAPGTEVRIADDGEVLIKGPGVMSGYHNLPEQTAEVFTADGWFRTGDIGELDERGRLRITDRKKDLIKTSGGKYVAPQTIEVRFKAVCPYASQIVVHGDGRNFVSALITLDPEAMAGWAEHNGMPGMPYEDVVATAQVREMVQGYVDQLNQTLPRHEQVKKFEILPRDLTVEDGDLTPSLKVKRKVVEKKYMHVLDGMYAGAGR